MARKISVSFKDTTKDIELYSLIMAMEDKSYEIKQILRAILIDKAKKNEKVEKVNSDVDITNF